MNNDLENVLGFFCEGSFENEKLKNMFYKLGKIYYYTQLEEHSKIHELEKSKDYALVDLVDYLINTRDKMFRKKTSDTFNNFLKNIYGNSN